MNIYKDYGGYLSGSMFSSGLKINYKFDKHPTSRIDAIKHIVKDKKVIHVGCVDHLEIIEKKITKNTWLHKIITENAEICLGIDTNRNGIDHLRKIGFTNVVNGDLASDEISEISEKNWNIILFGEILEHIDNPIEFLTTIREKYLHNVEEIVITVPNAFRYVNFKMALMGKEYINTDHRFWFTPYTISKLLVIAGYTISDLYLTNYTKFSFLNKVRHFLMHIIRSKIEIMRDDIVIIGKFKN